MARLNILVAEDNEDLRNLIVSVIQSKFEVNVLEAANAEEANSVLDREAINLVVSDYRMPGGNGNLILDHLSEKTENIPFILLSSDLIEDIPEFQNKEVYGNVRKPVFKDTLFQLIQSHLESSEKLGEMEEYFSVRKSIFKNFEIIDFDLFVRLSDDHYVKLVNAPADPRGEEFQKALNKNVNQFFIHRSQAKEFAENVEGIFIEKFPSEAPVKVQIKALEGCVEAIHSLNEAFGWNENLAQQVEAYVDDAIDTLKSYGKIKDFIEKMELDPENILYSHSALAVYIAQGILESQPDLNTDESRKIITEAALIHDMYITEELLLNIRNLGEEIDNEKYADWPDVIRYKEHPELVASDVIKMKGDDSALAMVLREHHELPDGSGFPLSLKGEELHPLSATLIISQRMAYFLMDYKKPYDFSKFFEDNKVLYASPKFSDIMASLASKLSE